MSNNDLELVKTGQSGSVQHFRIIPQGVASARAFNSISEEYGGDSSDVFDEDDGTVNVRPLTINGRGYQYVPFGVDDMLPHQLRKAVLGNMITAQCQQFNTICCYGQGLRFVDRKEKKDVDIPEITNFCLHNSLQECFAEQCTDMQMYNFSVTCIILSRDWDPLGDLEIRMGKQPDPATGLVHNKPTSDRKFAILSRMATPGYQYYPVPYYSSIFKDSWYDIYRLIGIGKRFMIKNTSAPRVQIEVHEEYWDNVCDNEHIEDEADRQQRKEQEKQNIIDFVCGVENAGKALVTGYYIDPNGKENRMVRIINLNDPSKKEGGNWSDDMQEAANALCFAYGVHPNLVGATPGKSQMNNSGSDKRELFTLKQALEKPYHDVMTKPYHVILHYNGWSERCTVDVPMLMLTTLDENKDAKKVSGNSNSNDNGDNNNQE